jgi:hypothetical protein
MRALSFFFPSLHPFVFLSFFSHFQKGSIIIAHLYFFPSSSSSFHLFFLLFSFSGGWNERMNERTREKINFSSTKLYNRAANEFGGEKNYFLFFEKKKKEKRILHFL